MFFSVCFVVRLRAYVESFANVTKKRQTAYETKNSTHGFWAMSMELECEQQSGALPFRIFHFVVNRLMRWYNSILGIYKLISCR